MVLFIYSPVHSFFQLLGVNKISQVPALLQECPSHEEGIQRQLKCGLST